MKRLFALAVILLATSASAFTRTTTQAGLWSAAATWGGIAPVDGDTAIIGHAVEQDIDMAAYVTGVVITINTGGSLEPSVTAGTYAIKCAGHITVNTGGRLGTATGAVPYGVKWIINLNGAHYITGAGTVRLICTEPSVTSVRLNTSASAGATVLDVRAMDGTAVDLSAGTVPWLATESVRVDQYGAVSSEARTIASVGVNTITITAGLTADKAIGSIISIITRNVRVTGATGYAFTSANALTLAAEVSGNSNGLSRCASASITGGVLTGNIYGVAYCTSAMIAGAILSGNIYGVAYCTSAMIAGAILSGNIYGVAYCTGTLSDATISGSNNALVWCSDIEARNVLMSVTTENSGYASLGAMSYAESIDHDQVTGAYRAWSKGGITDKQATTIPPGYAYAYSTALESTSWGCYERPLVAEPGRTIALRVYRYQSADAHAVAEIVGVGADPLAPGSTAYASATFPATATTWESVSLSWTNTSTLPIAVRVRVRGYGSGITLTSLPVLLSGGSVAVNGAGSVSVNGAGSVTVNGIPQ